MMFKFNRDVYGKNSGISPKPLQRPPQKSVVPAERGALLREFVANAERSDAPRSGIFDFCRGLLQACGLNHWS
jgi:hypothetical protein